MGFISLLIPVAYLGILIGSLATFSHLYRQRQLNAKLKLAPYFPPHTARNIYLSLLHLSDHDASHKVPESVLRAALLARAIEDVRRILEIRARKPAATQLLARGVVGDEIFQRIVRAEQEIELEAKDVVTEANALAPGWGQTIFQTANEMFHNKTLRRKLDAIKVTTDAEKIRWEETRENARRELLGEEPASGTAAIATEVPTSSVPVSENIVNAQTPETAPAGDSVQHSKKATSSDEEAVLVDTPAADPSSTPTSTPSAGGGGKNRKKKNKK